MNFISVERAKNSFDFVFVLIFHGFFILNKILFIQFELGITNAGVE